MTGMTGSRGDGRGGGSDAWAAGASRLEGSWPQLLFLTTGGNFGAPPPRFTGVVL